MQESYSAVLDFANHCDTAKMADDAKEIVRPLGFRQSSWAYVGILAPVMASFATFATATGFFLYLAIWRAWSIQGSSIVLVAIPLTGSALSAFGYRFWSHRLGTIYVNSHGIRAVTPFGFSSSFVAWNDVQKIEKRLEYQPLYIGYRLSWTVYGTQSAVFVPDTTRGFTEILHFLNDQIVNGKVEAVFVNRGTRVLREANSLADRAQRRAVLCSGYVTKVDRV